jgi:pilus assembly protein CpaC
LFSLACICWFPAGACGADEPAKSAAPPQDSPPNSGTPGKLVVTVGKSLIIDSPLKIQRISVANGELMEAVAVNPKEVLINGKAPGETSVIIWQENGTRLLYDLTVRMSPVRLEVVRQQLARDFPDNEINVTYENETAFVRGRVKDVIAADRVMAMVSTLGKSVNLLQVDIPPAETQILLKVRFANVERGLSTDLGFSFATGAFNQSTAVTTGQYPGATVSTGGTVSLADALNVFLFRRDLNLGAAIKALESKRLLETIAEPNVLAINGKEASFISGGEFPYPMVQGGASAGAVSIAFRQFGIRINFLPTITPRGTIQMSVTPEVSALDYANAVTFQGYTIPALTTRRVQTTVELETGQSFVIAGLMDNSMTETLNKIPGLSAIPLLGKLFQSRQQQRSNTELLVIVTPEIVRPLPADMPIPSLAMPQPFMKSNSGFPMTQPGMDKTGPVPVKAPHETMPLEQLVQQKKQGQAAPPPIVPQFLIMPTAPMPDANPGLAPAAPAAPPAPAAPAGNGK